MRVIQEMLFKCTTSIEDLREKSQISGKAWSRKRGANSIDLIREMFKYLNIVAKRQTAIKVIDPA